MLPAFSQWLMSCSEQEVDAALTHPRVLLASDGY